MTIVEANHIVLREWWDRSGKFQWRSWRLVNDKEELVATGGRACREWVEVWADLCAVFDLIATPESYALRGRRLREVESATRGRWLQVSWSHE